MIRLFAIAGVLAIAAPVGAQSVECKKTETQAECHDRLQCKPNEEIGDCQKRLLACTADESLDDCKKRHGGGQSNDRGNDRDNNRGGDRDNDRGNDRDTNRGDRDRDNGRRDDRDDNDRGGRRYDRDDGRRSSGGRRGRSGRSSFEANKTFGLGLELGEPDGLNGKYFLSPSGALDFGVGYIYDHYYYGDGLDLYADYLWHPVSLASTPAFELPFYVGGGVRFWDFHYCYMGLCDYGGTSVGIRVPFGISFDFNNVPLDIFLQLVPTLDFVSGDYYNRYGDRAHFGIDGSVGIRVWFK